MTTTLYSLIEQSAEAALDMQRRDGALPAGHNGPYHDAETPVRNTSHWLISFTKAYDISGRKRFLEAARRAARYLCSRDARPMRASFWHRKEPEKDTCNGLVGQAWTIEALVAATKLLESEEAVCLAEEVFLQHPFREEIALWRRVAADGQYLSIDPTLNHQIWFAASGALLAPLSGEEVDRRVRRFLDRLDRHFRAYRSGLIRHPIAPTYSWKRLVKSSARRIMRSRAARTALRSKEIGYHAFNMYGLGLLRRQYPEHAFWSTAAFQKAWEYLQSDGFFQDVQDSPYGFPYNPPGFEAAFALEVFGQGTGEEQRRWIIEQIHRCYDWSSNLMSQGTPDPATHSARLYEATRLPDVDIPVPSRKVPSAGEVRAERE